MNVPSLIGKFEIVKPIPGGGMGTVYLARDPDLDRLVAVKVIGADFDQPDIRKSFMREAKILSHLRHPNIVTLFEYGKFEGQPYIAMDYIAGETLADLIGRRAPLSITRRLQLIDEVCAGMAYAHRKKVVHRDLKPANLIEDAESGQAKILDFGISKLLEIEVSRGITQVRGTPSYMSPEQVVGGKVDHRSDIFAIGALSYELLSFQQAFDGVTPYAVQDKIVCEDAKPLGQVCPELDAAIISIVDRCLEKDPENRYQELDEMRGDLHRILAGMSTGAAPFLPFVEPPAHLFSTVRSAIYAGRYVLAAAILATGLISSGVWLTHRSASGLSVQQTVQHEVADLRDEALKQWQRGQRDQALSSVAKALALQRDNPETLALANNFLLEALRRAEDAATAARDAQAQTTSSYARAHELELNAARLARAGQPEQAIRAYADSAELFVKATAAESKKETPASPPDVPPPAPSSSLPTDRPALPADSATAPVSTGVGVRTPSATVAESPARSTSLAAPPGRATVDTDKAIRDLLHRYQDGYERLDVAAVQAVYPSIDARQLGRAFREYVSLKRQIDIGSIQVTKSGDTATVSGTMTIIPVFKIGKIYPARPGPQIVRFTLRKVDNSWIIQAETLG